MTSCEDLAHPPDILRSIKDFIIQTDVNQRKQIVMILLWIVLPVIPYVAYLN